MAINKEQIKANIVAYMKKYDHQPEWKACGINPREEGMYELGCEAYKELRAEGIIETVERISPKGRKMKICRLVQK